MWEKNLIFFPLFLHFTLTIYIFLLSSIKNYIFEMREEKNWKTGVGDGEDGEDNRELTTTENDQRSYFSAWQKLYFI